MNYSDILSLKPVQDFRRENPNLVLMPWGTSRNVPSFYDFKPDDTAETFHDSIKDIQQRSVNLPNNKGTIFVDTNLVQAIKLLNQAGLVTKACCSGHVCEQDWYYIDLEHDVVAQSPETDIYLHVYRRNPERTITSGYIMFECNDSLKEFFKDCLLHGEFLNEDDLPENMPRFAHIGERNDGVLYKNHLYMEYNKFYICRDTKEAHQYVIRWRTDTTDKVQRNCEILTMLIDYMLLI